MWINLLWLILGLALILAGANFLTDGASAIAKKFGISNLVIGLTVVAFGTSTPELVISIVAAINGSAPLAVGNVVGSNIFNILAIIGITAIVRPINIEKSVMTTEIPMVILSSVILLTLGYTFVLDGTPNIVSRVDGILLLIFFILFMRYTFATARRKDPAVTDPAETASSSISLPLWRSVLYVIGGLAALVWGGDKFVGGATGIAHAIGVSDAVIGLTIVAVGTSLPELATSVVAAAKNQAAIAVGNVIGSNIFNVLMVLGTAAVVRPLPFDGITHTDLWVLMGASLMFFIFGWQFRHRQITRAEGIIMASCYIAYSAWLVATV